MTNRIKKGIVKGYKEKKHRNIPVVTETSHSNLLLVYFLNQAK
jgi:hypothetical protein